LNSVFIFFLKKASIKADEGRATTGFQYRATLLASDTRSKFFKGLVRFDGQTYSIGQAKTFIEVDYNPQVNPSSDSASRPSSAPSAFALLLPFALAYGISYFFRNVNAVAGPTLAREFLLGPQGLGFLTSSYFFGFSAAQIPLGILLDRYGPPRVGAGMALASGIGAVIFALAGSTVEIGIGRALIGMGAGAGLMGAMSAVHLVVGRDRAATVTGWIMIAGGLGAMFASTPTQWALDAYGWRSIFFVLAGACAAIAVWLGSRARYMRPAASGQTLKQLLGGVREVFSARRFWQVGMVIGLTLGTFLAFQSLWAATWMRDVAGYTDRTAVSNVLLALNFGMAIGFVCSGMIGDWLARRGVARLTTLMGYVAVSLLSQAFIMLFPAMAPHWAWGMYAASANSVVFGYAALASSFPATSTGRVNTAINLLSFGLAFVLQAVIGAWLNTYPLTAGKYASEGYYGAWIALWVGQAVLLLALALYQRSSPLSDQTAVHQVACTSDK
jgi:MFS family permease